MAAPNKLALLVGCNYTNNPAVRDDYKLHGCINDVKAMEALLHQRFGFEDITILTDEKKTSPTSIPTFSNIKAALKQMIDVAKPGDILLFYFSGGGALVNPTSTTEINKGIPAIIPSDLSPMTGKLILDIIKPLSDKAIFTFISDSSYSGGLFDNQAQTESNVPCSGPYFGRKTFPSDILDQRSDVGGKSAAGISLNNRILISSSRANEESVEVYPNRDKSKAFGAFSTAIQTLLNSPEAVNTNPAVAKDDPKARNTNREVTAFTRALCGFLGFEQRPYLNCIDIDAAAPFLGGYVA